MLYMLCSKAIASVTGRYHKECFVENVLASLKMCFPGSDACVCSRGCVQAVEGRGRAMEKLQGVGLKPWMDVFGMRIEDGEVAPNRAAGKDEVKLRAPSSYPSSACCYWKQAQYHLIS